MKNALIASGSAASLAAIFLADDYGSVILGGILGAGVALVSWSADRRKKNGARVK